MPYSKVWAERILENYENSATRCRNVDLCIQQIYESRTTRRCSLMQIRIAKIHSLQGTGNKKIWPLYKRLVKKTPLDRELLKKVTDLFIWEIDVDALQMEFNFYD